MFILEPHSASFLSITVEGHSHSSQMHQDLHWKPVCWWDDDQVNMTSIRCAQHLPNIVVSSTIVHIVYIIPVSLIVAICVHMGV